ncbi:MAG: amino acid decarboxylase, partial [Firmicutes bacterium]|nr:amino acid decarboxylase [Bacillota bacterium]
AKPLPPARGQQILSPRQCLFSPWETVPAEQSLGRICANAALSCPPAIPIAVAGERIEPEALVLFRHYGLSYVNVIR